MTADGASAALVERAAAALGAAGYRELPMEALWWLRQLDAASARPLAES